MALEPLITFRHMNHDDDLDAAIRRRVAKLERFHDRITHCEVLVQAPHAGHHNKGAHYQVRIELHVPGDERVVDRDPLQAADHADAAVALRDAFEAATRQLQKYARRRRGSDDRRAEQPRS